MKRGLELFKRLSNQDLVLVHNKVDLADECQRVKKASGEQIAKKLNISFHTTSVMRDQGVNEVFKRLGTGFTV